MAIISNLNVKNIRTHESFKISLSPTVTVITGQNGSGKTSLIEAIYIAMQGSSFKGSDSHVLRSGSEWWRIDLKQDDQSRRTVKYEPAKTTGKKQFTVNGKVSYRLFPKDKYPVVLFEPDDLRLLHGSPTRRRQFIDRFISQLDPIYHSALKKYERALKQRNALLKNHTTTPDDIFAWNVSLSEYGSYIIESRVNFIESINRQLNEEYNTISHAGDTISIHYSHTIIGDTKARLLSELYSSTERDKLLGYTSVGPHRHDIVFIFNDQPAINVASRGEVRTIILALKFIEITITRHLTDKDPIILLDDVFSELDESRQDYLMNSPKGQIIITSAHTPTNIKDYYSVLL